MLIKITSYILIYNLNGTKIPFKPENAKIYHY